MEKHHHTIAILAILFALLAGIIGGWMFFTWRAQPVQVVMTEEEFTRPISENDVFINGMPLEEANPLPSGDYWYDGQSGLYGHIGEAALGVMPAGYSAPSMMADASSGTTGVFFNNRELPSVELAIYEQELGIPLIPGKYSLDGDGMIWQGAQSLGLITLGGARPPPPSLENSQLPSDERTL